MTKRLGYLLPVMALVACGSSVPDSNPRGAGFSSYDNYTATTAARDAELEGRPVSDARERTIGSETIAVLDATAPAGAEGPITVTSSAPLDARTPAATEVAPAAAPSPINNSGISDEQDFSAVSSRESIESDAERLARQRAAYEVIAPTAVPTREGSSGPNVVAFALATTNQVGEQLYRRGGFNRENRFLRACASYPSQDRAQEAFLAAGGPERDRRGMDPDGDGFACYWDPTAYRTARGASN